MSFLFGQPGGSQLYFARSMAPFLAILSAWGAAALVPPDRANRRVAAALLGSALLGGAIMTALVVAGPERPPSVIRMSRRDVALALVQPYLAAVLVIVGLGLALVLLRRRYAALRGISAALVVALVLGLGLTRLIPLVRGPLDHVRTTGGLAYVVGNGSQGRPIAPGGVEAARWLRDHSDPDDVVATNTHCRDVVDGRCGNLHFWVAAYTERRILVEGWGYTPSANRVRGDEPPSQRPFWRPDVLAENDRAFTEPTRANLDRLRDRYGVRWLFVDDRYDRPAPELDDVARLRFRAGNAAVYQVP